MAELQPDDVDSLRRVVSSGKPEVALAYELPNEVSLGAAAELACWFSTQQFLNSIQLRAHFHTWCKQAHIVRAAAQALWVQKTRVEEESGPVGFLTCPTTQEEFERRCDVLGEFGARFIEAAVRVSRFSKDWSYGLWKAVWDLVENIVVHGSLPADSPHWGFVGYRATPRYLEIVVADVGQGVFRSLTRNPRYARLPTSADALRAVVRDGATASRGTEDATGGGIELMFRKIASRRGTIRFRSGDGALRIDGDLNQTRERTGPSPAMAGLQVYIKIEVTGA